jgi:hypothetical protein
VTARTCAFCGERDAVTTERFEGRTFPSCASCLTPAVVAAPDRPDVGAANCARVLAAARTLGTFATADLVPLTGLSPHTLRKIALALRIDGALRLVEFRQGGPGGGSRYEAVS